MEISEIKARLTLAQVLHYYHLKPDKQLRLCCPFHEDNTPSLQFSREKNIATCFSSQCDAGTMDIIDLVEKKQGCSKHEAIVWLTELVGIPVAGIPVNSNGKTSPAKNNTDIPLERIAVLTKAFRYFESCIRRSPPAKAYAASRMLDIDRLERLGVPIGYHNGKFHQGQNKLFIESAIKYGLLSPFAHGGYQHFGKDSLVFALRNQQQQISGLYFRSIKEDEDVEVKHVYLKNRQGLYPRYPTPDTQHLVLTESIIDCATLLQQQESFTLPGLSLLALYGTNGLTDEHRKVLESLSELREIILFMDGDVAGKAAVKKYSRELSNLPQQPVTSYVDTPEGEDVNSLAQSHEPDIFTYLLQSRKLIAFSEHYHSGEGKNMPAIETTVTEPSTAQAKQLTGKLITDNPDLLIYQTEQLRFTLLGGIYMKQLDRLRVTLKTQTQDSHQSYRQSLDLYRDEQTERYISKASEKLEIGSSLLMQAISELTDALEQYRLQQREQQQVQKPEKRQLTQERYQAAVAYLKTKDLLKRTNADLARTGIVGEAVNRLILWLVFTSRLRERPLHVICLGASGTGKTYLQEKVSALIPKEDKLSITLLSENALYYFGQKQLSHKLILLEDMDGAGDERILYAIRELQTKRSISKSVVLKDSRGTLRTVTMQVDGPISLAGTTTREKLYEDNANRCLLIYLDSSSKQQKEIMTYQRKVSAGSINIIQESKLKDFMQDVQSMLKPVQVRNPYAEQLQLPPSVFKPLRTQEHYLLFIETITFYHQYQRAIKTDQATGAHYIETTLEDIKAANTLLKDVLLAKSDELSGACRSFLERLKVYVAQSGKPSFYSQQIRQAFRMTPPTVKRHLYQLVQYGYVKITGGSKYKGYEYEVADAKEYEQLGRQLHTALDEILQRLTVSAVAQ